MEQIKIKSIKKLPYKLDRYDLTIDSTHNFFANGILIHNTSAIFANILTNVPTNWFKRMWRKYITHTTEYDQKYNVVYSSRTIVKNEYINKKQKPGGYYSDDIWGYWAQKLNGLIPNDYCIYCEIAGFTPNGSVIQKGYDYGCSQVAEEKSKLMVYRATKNGKELEISDVIEIGNKLREKLGDVIMPFPLLYHGTLKDLYPNISTTEHWHENVLELLKGEKRFGMEENEPLCKTKVPREGFVLRKANDPVAEAWKLKTDAFRLREAKLVDAGEVDAEMAEGYNYDGGNQWTL